MKKILSFLLVAVLLVGAAPATQAQTYKSIKPKEANQLLQKMVGEWQVNHYVRSFDFEKDKLTEAIGNASYSRNTEGDYVHEQSVLKQPDGTSIQSESYLRYSEAKEQFEYVQLDKTGKSIVLMVGKWSPKYQTLAFRPVKGEGQWNSKIDPNLQCLYLFKHDGTFMRLTRTFDKNGNCVILSQDHYSSPRVANL